MPDNTLPVTEENSDSSSSRLPTLKEYQKHKATQAIDKASTPEKQDNADIPNEAFKKNFNFANMSPQQRSETGAKLGAGIGMSLTGPMGAIFGMTAGATAAHGFGQVQSGEYIRKVRNDNFLKTLNELGVSDKSGSKYMFSDGDGLDLANSPDGRLQNFNSVKTRDVFEVDRGHPLTNRTKTTAYPIAHYITSALLKYANPESQEDVTALENNTNFLVNTLQSGTTNSAQVNKRALELTEKLGCNEAHMRGYFNAIRKGLTPEQAKTIKTGLDSIYGRKK